jgi:DNA replication protein DnaC
MILRDMGPRYSPERVSIETYRLYDLKQEQVLKQVRELVGRLPEMVKNAENLILYGPCGTGKDHLVAALLYRATGDHGIHSRYVSGQDFFATIRDRMDAGQEAYFKSLKTPAILAMSDLVSPRRDPTAWQIECLYRLIDHRYRDLKPTWVTLNVANAAEADESLTAPVFDRLKDNAHMIPCFWPSHRREKKSVA